MWQRRPTGKLKRRWPKTLDHYRDRHNWSFLRILPQEATMKKSRFTESQIFSILKEVDAGMKVEAVCRKHGISNATYYNWKAKYGGMDTSELKRMRELEEENAKLKKMFADVSLQNQAMKELFAKKGW